MKEFWHYIQALFSAIGGFLGFFLGGMDGLLYALLCFVIIDYITGVIYGIYNKSLSSETGFKGLLKKVLIFALVGVGHVIDHHVIHQGDVIRSAICFFYISNEGISILENCAKLGLPIPKKLKQILKQIREEGKKK